MKSIVIYSSLTGNTKQVAEAITSVLPAGTPCVSMKELPSDLSSYDLVFAGFWVDKGTANKEARDVLGTLHTLTLLCLPQLAYHRKWHMLRRA